jgi:hypothetical protein
MGIVALEQFVPIRFYGMLARRVVRRHRALMLAHESLDRIPERHWAASQAHAIDHAPAAR